MKKFIYLNGLAAGHSKHKITQEACVIWLDSWTKFMKLFLWINSLSFFESLSVSAAFFLRVKLKTLVLMVVPCTDFAILRATYGMFIYLKANDVFSMLPGFSARLMPKGNEKRKPGEDQALHNHDGLEDDSNPKLINVSRMMQIAWGCGRIQEVMEMGVQDAQHRSKALPPKIRGMGGLQNLMKQMGPAKDMMGMFGGGD
ncbi:hypothetical protein Godav_008489, partial [Gossypium davidsonii]|nr:hypothetical protein [Gossypium davidsonii]